MHKQGLEMLKIFRNHSLRTSLLDDFMYYENRQKIMEEGKAKLIFKSFETPYLASAFDPTHNLNSRVELPPNKDEKIMEQNDPNRLMKAEASAPEQLTSNSDVTFLSTRSENSEQTTVKAGDDIASALMIGSLDINPKQAEIKPLPDAVNSDASSEHVDVVTVGSMPVKVNGFAESSGFLTVGTIPLNPRALRLEKVGAFAKHGSQC